MIGEKIQYAPNRNGKLISINEAKRGLACNCICPACKSVLIARKGDVRIPHFAHYKNNSCATGYQTSLHLLAKELPASLPAFSASPDITSLIWLPMPFADGII